MDFIVQLRKIIIFTYAVKIKQLILDTFIEMSLYYLTLLSKIKNNLLYYMKYMYFSKFFVSRYSFCLSLAIKLTHIISP